MSEMLKKYDKDFSTDYRGELSVSSITVESAMELMHEIPEWSVLSHQTQLWIAEKVAEFALAVHDSIIEAKSGEVE